MLNSTSLDDNISLGKMLNKARLDKKLSVYDLSIITKIHKTLIHSLENDEIANLPNRIYVLGFLKSMSEVLHYDLEKSIYLYELSLMKMNESNIPEEKILIETPEKVVPINFFTQKKLIKVKWLLACFIFFITMLIISPLFVRNDNKSVEAATPQERLVNKFKQRPKKEIVMSQPVVRSASSYNVSINASQGVSWISFQVDKNPIRKITLKKGSSIILRGESIKLVLGNYRALTVKNNKEAVSINKYINGDVARINFPQDKSDFSPAQKLIFTLENKVYDQTQRL